MATYEIVAWRGIPALVEARDTGGSVSRPLGERFQALIDSIAMLGGRGSSEAYLEEWSRSPAAERAGSAAEVADAVAAELEARFQEFAARGLRPG